MSLGRRLPAAFEAPVAPQLATPRGAFWERLARALEAERFDDWIQERVRGHYAPRRGRPSLPRGIYFFRMLLIGRIEGIGSQRSA
jgi:hypothetical protein